MVSKSMAQTSGSESLPKHLKARCGPRRQRLRHDAGDGLVALVVTRQLIDGAIDNVQQLQAKPHTHSDRPAAISGGHTPYVVNRQSGILIVELPCSQDRKQCEDIFILKPLQLIRATPQKDQIWKWLTGDKRFKNDGGGTRVKSCRIPVDQGWHKLSACENQFLRKRMCQLHRSALVFIFDSLPFPPLQLLRFLALCTYSSLGSLLLMVCATQRNQHCDQRNDGRSPAAQCGESGPVEIAGCSIFKARSQVLEFGQLQLPLWTGRHSATAIIRAALTHG